MFWVFKHHDISSYRSAQKYEINSHLINLLLDFPTEFQRVFVKRVLLVSMIIVSFIIMVAHGVGGVWVGIHLFHPVCKCYIKRREAWTHFVFGMQVCSI